MKNAPPLVDGGAKVVQQIENQQNTLCASVPSSSIDFSETDYAISDAERPSFNVASAPAAMSLEDVRAALRLISGTPLRDDVDRLRRQALWRRLDQLIAGAS